MHQEVISISCTSITFRVILFHKLTCSSWLYHEEINRKHEGGDEDEITIVESLQFNFDIIRVATNDFSDSNKLGQGGFGIVYKVK